MRIIQISDLHFGMHNPQIIESFLKDIELLKPDLILISGDITQRAREQQYILIQNFLKRFSQPYLIVPGNHDIPLNPIHRLYQPFKRYKRYISSDLESHFSNAEVNILGVNSVNRFKIKDGRLSKSTLNRIRNHFSADSEQLNILFFHHNLNYFSGMHHPLNNADEFINYLKESPIHIVCTGHLHYANIKIIDKNQYEQFALLHAGTLFCKRSRDNMNSFYVIDTNKLKCIINRRVFAEGCFNSQQSIEFDPCKSS
ncbi:MAG: metallophosphoesterase [Tatlockia sp.]|nr:metallophosphoesterase [Tatlockia sp.]